MSLGKAGSVSGWGQAGEPFEDAHEIFGVVISAGFGYLSDAHRGRQEQLLSSFDADPPDLSGDTDAEPPLIDGRQVRGRIVEVFCYAGNTDPVAGVDTDPILDLLEGAVLVVSFLTVLGRGPSHGNLHEQAGHEIAAVGAGIRVGALVDVQQLVEHDGQPIVVCQTKIQGQHHACRALVISIPLFVRQALNPLPVRQGEVGPVEGQRLLSQPSTALMRGAGRNQQQAACLQIMMPSGYRQREEALFNQDQLKAVDGAALVDPSGSADEAPCGFEDRRIVGETGDDCLIRADRPPCS